MFEITISDSKIMSVIHFEHLKTFLVYFHHKHSKQLKVRNKKKKKNKDAKLLITSNETNQIRHS